MRIDAIRNCGITVPAAQKSSSHSLPKKNDMLQNSLTHDSLSFKQGGITKGAAAGTTFGFLAISALAAVSGFTVPPLLCLLYAAAFGTAGGIAGKAHDDAEGSKVIVA